MRKLAKSLALTWLLTFAISLFAWQVAMNTWAASNFVGGYTVMWLSSAWKAAPLSQGYDHRYAPWAIPVFNQQRSAVTVAIGNGSITHYGHNPTSTNCTTGAAPDANNAIYNLCNTGPTVNTVASIVSAQTILRTGRDVKFQTGGAVDSTADPNYILWFGITDQTATTMTSADDPAGNYAGFRFDTATDTHFTCVTKDNTTQATGDSGITPSTTGHTFEVSEDTADGDYNFSIDGSQVCSISTHLPTTGTNVGYVVAIQNTTTNKRGKWDFWWAFTTANK